MALDTVQDYVVAARTLLQDEQTPYRYTDAQMAEALGFALMEARKMRPDLFITSSGAVQNVNRSTSMAQAVIMEEMYRVAFTYYIVGHMYLRDEEEGSQSLAAGYMNRFAAKLMSLAA